MAREAFYIRSKGPGTIIDQLFTSSLQLNKNANAQRMLFLSNNLDSVRQYGFTVEFHFPDTYNSLVTSKVGTFNSDQIPYISLAVKSVDLPDFTAKVQHTAMLGMSGQTINYHVDKKFKIKVEELTGDTLLHKLRYNGLLHQLGDSETQESIRYGSGDSFFIKIPHKTCDVRLKKHLANGEIHSVLDFTHCKVIGFKQATFDYAKTNAMSEIDLEIVFDELISVPNNETYLAKTPREIANQLPL